MELIVINENKLKIMLTNDDMERFDLVADTVSYDKEETRTALRNILDEVRIETGFDTENDRILVQLYPSRDGGCEMFVTKIDLSEILSAAEKEEEVMTDDPRQLLPFRAPKKPVSLRKIRDVYCFSKLDALLSACRELCRRNTTQESTAYIDKEGRYYLFFAKTCTENEKLSLRALLSEFGSQENAETAELYINENGRCLCEARAVETLGVL